MAAAAGLERRMSTLCLGGAAADSRQRLTEGYRGWSDNIMTSRAVTSTLRHDAYMAVDYMSVYPILEPVYTTVYIKKRM